MLQKRFRNQFLDNLIADANLHEQVKMLRIFGTGLDRKELATFLNIDIHSIRRYESNWNTAPVPQWYFHILRFLSGDLSIYGDLWTDSKIKLHNQTISTPFDKYREYTPMDLNSRYSYIHKKNENLLKEKDLEIKNLKKKIIELEKLNRNIGNNVIDIKKYKSK